MRYTGDVIPGEAMSSAGPPTYQPMYPVPHPATIGLPLAQAGMVLAGFQDCASEAIRYLVEVEHMSPHDPFVMGLKNHLHDCQRQLDYNQLLRQCDIVTSSSQHEQSLNDSGISDNVVDTQESGQFLSQTPCVQTDDNSTLNPSQTLSFESLQSDNPAITALAEELLFLLEEEAIDDMIDDEEEEIIEQ